MPLEFAAVGDPHWPLLEVEEEEALAAADPVDVERLALPVLGEVLLLVPLEALSDPVDCESLPVPVEPLLSDVGFVDPPAHP